MSKLNTTLKVEKFACTNFRDRNFREIRGNLFSRYFFSKIRSFDYLSHDPMMRDIDSMTQLIQLISIKWLTGQRYDTMVQSFDDPMMRHLDSMTQLSNDTLQRFNHSLYYPMV